MLTTSKVTKMRTLNHHSENASGNVHLWLKYGFT